MPKVSIIMPSLNVAPYIEKCMDSVSGQTLQDIEVLCVDADSTDGTHEILEKYAKQDTRVHLLRDDKHSTGYAKNLGIDMAKGEYIGIVEPDDYIEPDMYRRLYEAAMADRADVVKCDYSVYVTLDNQCFYVPKKLSFVPDDYGVLMNPKETLKPFGWEMYTWAGIYRTDFLKKKKIRHHETPGAAYQDIGFWFQCYAESEKVKLIPSTGYCYCKDNPDASTKNANHLIRGLDELAWVKSFYGCQKNRWEYLQPAWILEIIRFVTMASNSLAGDELHALLSRVRAMLADTMIDEKRMKALLKNWEYEKYKLFSSPSATLERAITEKKKNVQDGQRKLKQILDEHDNLIIVSAGSHGANLQIILKKNFNRAAIAFADNDKKKQGRFLNGVSIMSLEEAAKRNQKGFFLIANQVYGQRLRKQLIELGIGDNCMEIIPVDRIADTYL